MVSCRTANNHKCRCAQDSLTMTKKPNAADFLRAMGSVPEPDAPPALAPAAAPAEAVPAAVVHTLPQARKAGAKPAKPSRAQLKHFGGYLEDETLEKIALLRV